MKRIFLLVTALWAALSWADPWMAATSDAAAVAAKVKPVGRSAAAISKGPGHIALTADFTNHDKEREAWDIRLPLDMSKANGVQFDFRCSDLDAVRSFIAYFKSGQGWYVARFDVPKAGEWCRVKVLKSGCFKIEGDIKGWSGISTLRIGGWKGLDQRSAVLEMRGLEIVPEDAAPQVVVVMSDSCAARQANSESDAYLSFARRMHRQIAVLGVRTIMVSDFDVAGDLPASAKVAVFAYNPSVPEGAKTALERFVSRGGKIFACHTTDADVRRMAGIPKDLYVGRDYRTPTVPDKVANGLFLKHVWRYPPDRSLPLMESALLTLMPECADAIAAAKRRINDEAAKERAYVESVPGKAGEWRAFWCHSAFGLRSTNSWDHSAAVLKAGGFNAVLPNLASGGVAFYESKVLPVHPDVEKRGDQLLACLSACRKYGVECHAWKMCWNMGRHADKEFVGRMVAEGRCQISSSGEINRKWLCPSHPANLALEIEAFAELAQKGVDGIHLDYIRYPDNRHCFCERCKKTVRNDNITALVKAVSERVRRESPGVKISAAVFACPRAVAQDWVKWCHAGLLDFVCPMDYSEDKGFRNLVARQRGDVAGANVKLRPGLGLSCWTDRDHDALNLTKQIEAIRSLGLDGFAVFELDDRAVAVLPALRSGLARDCATER